MSSGAAAGVSTSACAVVGVVCAAVGRCDACLFRQLGEVGVDLCDRGVGDSPSQLRRLRLRPFRERLAVGGQIAAACELAAFALRQQHVVDAQLLEASGSVEAVLAAGLAFGRRHPLPGRHHACHARACCLQAGAQVLQPSSFADLHVAGE